MDNEPIVPKPFPKSVYVVFGVVALIVIAALAYFAFSSKRKQSAEPVKKTTTLNKLEESRTNLVKKEVNPSQLPDKFPSDIPLEAGAKIEQNFTQQAESGQFQATRVFATAKTLEENYNIYLNYMKSSGWTVISNINQETLKSLTGKKGTALLQIDINQNTVTKVKTVDITYSDHLVAGK